MRLFIAIEFSNLKEYCQTIQEKLKSTDAKLNFTKTYHLTLKFLGEIQESKLEQIKAALSNIKFKNFTVKLNSTGTFPSENYIRVIWLGFKDNRDIIDLQNKVDTALEQMFPKDKKFSPHLTLARVKFVKDKKQLIDKIKAIKIDPIESNIKSFKLIKSTLTPDGPIYDDIFEINAKN